MSFFSILLDSQLKIFLWRILSRNLFLLLIMGTNPPNCQEYYHPINKYKFQFALIKYSFHRIHAIYACLLACFIHSSSTHASTCPFVYLHYVQCCGISSVWDNTESLIAKYPHWSISKFLQILSIAPVMMSWF